MKREVLAMIPGTLCDELLFQPQLTALSDLVDCKVISSCSADTLTKQASDILDQLPAKFSIFGLSYGGILAFEIWRQAPERIQKLILANTNYLPPSEQTRTSQQRFVGMACLGEFEAITRDILTDVMLHPIHAKQRELRKTVLQMSLNVGKNGFIRQVKAQLGRPDSTADLSRIQCPTLVITGKEDRVCPLHLHEEINRRIPNAQLAIIDQCGHLSTLEQPTVVNTLIREWWSNN